MRSSEPGYRGERWLPVTVAVVGVLFVGSISVISLGFATFAADSCAPDIPCPPEQAIWRTFFATLGLVLALLAALIVFNRRGHPDRRQWLLTALAIAVAAWPACWVWVFGGPATP